MNVRRKVNKNHPDYLKYIEKCYHLRDVYLAQEKKEKAKYPDLRMQEQLSAKEVHAIRKKFYAELRELQKEYDYLFSDIEE